MSVINAITVKRAHPNYGVYLRWYFNGWHHYYFRVAEENFDSSGEKYKTRLEYKLVIGDDQLTKSMLFGIKGIIVSSHIFMLTSDGWKAVTVEDATLPYGRNDSNAAQISLTINVWAKVGQFSPVVPPVISLPPTLILSATSLIFTQALFNPSTAQSWHSFIIAAFMSAVS